MNLVVTLLSLLAIVVLICGQRAVRRGRILPDRTRAQHRRGQRPQRRPSRPLRPPRPPHGCRFSCPARSWASRSPRWSRDTSPSRWWPKLPHPAMDALGISDRVADAVIAFLALVVVTSVSMVFGELVPKYLAVARPLRTARAVVGLQLLFSLLMTYPIRVTNGAANWIVRKLGIEPAEELRSARSAQELVSLVRTSARSGSLDPATAALLRPLAAVRRPDRRGADDAAVENRCAASRQHRRRPGRGRRRERLLPVSDRRRRPRRDRRHRARQAGVRSSARRARESRC